MGQFWGRIPQALGIPTVEGVQPQGLLEVLRCLGEVALAPLHIGHPGPNERIVGTQLFGPLERAQRSLVVQEQVILQEPLGDERLGVAWSQLTGGLERILAGPVPLLAPIVAEPHHVPVGTGEPGVGRREGRVKAHGLLEHLDGIPDVPLHVAPVEAAGPPEVGLVRLQVLRW